MHVMNDTADPFYTSLRAGEYTASKPSGHPCDAVYKCKKLSTDDEIIIIVVVLAVFLKVVGVTWLVLRKRPDLLQMI